MSSVAYIMQWGDHKTNVHSHLRVLFEEQKFVDLTLFCSTHSVKVHSVVVASNSSYFEKVLLSQNGVNSVIVLKDMKFEVLRALIEFMYCGETTVLDEDVDALLYASKKFEVKGLSRMTRQGVMFSTTEKSTNENAGPNHGFIFPAESANPGMIQAVIDLTKKENQTEIIETNALDSLYFKKTVFQKRGKPHKKPESLGFSEAAMSDTEYAILKEAEESRKALEKLQKYVLYPNGIDSNSQVSLVNNSFLKANNHHSKQEESKINDVSRSRSKNLMEDEIAAQNLSHELNLPQHPRQPHTTQQQSNQNDISESTLLPTDVPIFVDDGNGNYVTLDVEMANMIAGQEIKYNLVQGVVMTSDGKGSQLSNPASILIPENQSQPESLPILNYEESEINKSCEGSIGTTAEKFIKSFTSDVNEGISTEKLLSKRKPFVVKEIIKLKQPKRVLSKENGQEEDDENSRKGLIKFDHSGFQSLLF